MVPACGRGRRGLGGGGARADIPDPPFTIYQIHEFALLLLLLARISSSRLAWCLHRRLSIRLFSILRHQCLRMRKFLLMRLQCCFSLRLLQKVPYIMPQRLLGLWQFLEQVIFIGNYLVCHSFHRQFLEQVKKMSDLSEGYNIVGLSQSSTQSSFGMSEYTFADIGNLDHCTKYLNQTLVTFGFPASLDLFATDPVSIARTCNCIYSLLQQRQRDIEFRESANEQRQRKLKLRQLSRPKLRSCNRREMNFKGWLLAISK